MCCRLRQQVGTEKVPIALIFGLRLLANVLGGVHQKQIKIKSQTSRLLKCEFLDFQSLNLKLFLQGISFEVKTLRL